MPGIIFPVIVAFVGLVGLVGSVIYYGRQHLPPKKSVAAVAMITATTTAETRLRPFDIFAYELAKGEEKAILLYFTAPWCPECDYAQVRLAEAAAGWPNDQLVVFLVDFPNQVDDFQVMVPDTKILLRGAQVIKKSVEVWTLEDYREEIQKVLRQ